MISKDAKVYVAGHVGLVGSAIVRKLKEKGYDNLLFRTHAELDLMDGRAVEDIFQCGESRIMFFWRRRKVGGIMANNIYRADFIYNNIQIQNNVIYNCL